MIVDVLSSVLLSSVLLRCFTCLQLHCSFSFFFFISLVLISDLNIWPCLCRFPTPTWLNHYSLLVFKAGQMLVDVVEFSPTSNSFLSLFPRKMKCIWTWCWTLFLKQCTGSLGILTRPRPPSPSSTSRWVDHRGVDRRTWSSDCC